MLSSLLLAFAGFAAVHLITFQAQDVRFRGTNQIFYLLDCFGGASNPDDFSQIVFYPDFEQSLNKQLPEQNDALAFDGLFTFENALMSPSSTRRSSP